MIFTDVTSPYWESISEQIFFCCCPSEVVWWKGSLNFGLYLLFVCLGAKIRRIHSNEFWITQFINNGLLKKRRPGLRNPAASAHHLHETEPLFYSWPNPKRGRSAIRRRNWWFVTLLSSVFENFNIWLRSGCWNWIVALIFHPDYWPFLRMFLRFSKFSLCPSGFPQNNFQFSVFKPLNFQLSTI